MANSGQFKVVNLDPAAGVFTDALDQDSTRRFIQIQNQGDSDIYINFGDEVPSQQNSIRVASGGHYEPWSCPTNKLTIATAIGSASASHVVVISDASSTRVSGV